MTQTPHKSWCTRRTSIKDCRLLRFLKQQFATRLLTNRWAELKEQVCCKARTNARHLPRFEHVGEVDEARLIAPAHARIQQKAHGEQARRDHPLRSCMPQSSRYSQHLGLGKDAQPYNQPPARACKADLMRYQANRMSSDALMESSTVPACGHAPPGARWPFNAMLS